MKVIDMKLAPKIFEALHKLDSLSKIDHNYLTNKATRMILVSLESSYNSTFKYVNSQSRFLLNFMLNITLKILKIGLFLTFLPFFRKV